MRHSTCRSAILDQNLGDSVKAHLNHCARCATFARSLAEVLQHAPSLAPVGVPEGLEDRIMGRLATAMPSAPAEAASQSALSEIPLTRGTDAGATVTSLAVGRSLRDALSRSQAKVAPFRRAFTYAAAATVLLALVATFAAVRGPGGSGQQTRALHNLLLTAADVTQAAGTAQIQLTASSQISFTIPAIPVPQVTVPPLPTPPPPGIPSCTQVPAGGAQAPSSSETSSGSGSASGSTSAGASGGASASAGSSGNVSAGSSGSAPPASNAPNASGSQSAGAPPSPSQFQAQAQAQQEAACQAAAAQAQQNYQDQIAQFQQCIAQVNAQAGRVAVPTVPTSLSYAFAVDGSGVVAESGQLDVKGTTKLTHSSPAVADGTHTYELIVTGGHAYIQIDGGSWQEIPGPAGSLGPMVLDPSSIPTLMRSANGGVTDLGTSQMDGVEVDHLRFQAPTSAIPGASSGVSFTVDVWVGVADHLVRQFQTSSSGAANNGPAGFSAQSTMTLELSNFGVPVNVVAPPAVSGTLQPQGGPGVVIYPFPNGLSFSMSESSKSSGTGTEPSAVGKSSSAAVPPGCTVSGSSTPPQGTYSGGTYSGGTNLAQGSGGGYPSPSGGYSAPPPGVNSPCNSSGSSTSSQSSAQTCTCSPTQSGGTCTWTASNCPWNTQGSATCGCPPSQMQGSCSCPSGSSGTCKWSGSGGSCSWSSSGGTCTWSGQGGCQSGSGCSAHTGSDGAPTYPSSDPSGSTSTTAPANCNQYNQSGCPTYSQYQYQQSTTSTQASS